MFNMNINPFMKKKVDIMIKDKKFSFSKIRKTAIINSKAISNLLLLEKIRKLMFYRSYMKPVTSPNTKKKLKSIMTSNNLGAILNSLETKEDGDYSSKKNENKRIGFKKCHTIRLNPYP